MPRWDLSDIPWDSFQPELVEPDLLAVVKAACLVEHNSASYADYLCRVFADDPAMCADAREWALEEIQHGEALKTWAKLADDQFDGDVALEEFAAEIVLPDVDESIRGSRLGELVSRCIVETGTSSFYSALREKSREPVLAEICKRIAADEFAHYRLFSEHAKKYQGDAGVIARLKCALGRISETSDDELAYAFYCGSGKRGAYSRKHHGDCYTYIGLQRYQRKHLDRAVVMILKAVGLNGANWLARAAKAIAWRFLCRHRSMLGRRLRAGGFPIPA